MCSPLSKIVAILFAALERNDEKIEAYSTEVPKKMDMNRNFSFINSIVSDWTRDDL